MVSNTAAKDVDVNSANKKVNLCTLIYVYPNRKKKKKDIDVIILTYKLIEYNDNHSK